MKFRLGNVKNFPSLCQRQDVWQGLYASIIPLLIKNRFAADSDFMIISEDLIFDFVLCPCCVLGYALPSTENISVLSVWKGGYPWHGNS